MTPLTKHSAYIEANNQREKVGHALSLVNGRIAELEAQRRVRDSEDQAALTADRDRRALDAAFRFADSGQITAELEAEKELTALMSQRSALTRALHQASDNVEQVSRELSAAVCKDLAPAHRKLATRYLAALQQMDDVLREENALLAELFVNGYEGRFPVSMQWHAIGSIGDSMGSPAYYRARELREYLK